MNDRVDDAVVGAGIVGLAFAYALAKRGRRVAVFERGDRALGASARNFGTLWPVGQPAGPRRTLALASLQLWRDLLRDSRIWHAPTGSLHVAYTDDELRVLSEFAADAAVDGFECDFLDPDETRLRCGHLRVTGLAGGLWSPNEIQVNPREVLAALPRWLRERFGVLFNWATTVTACAGGVIKAGERRWQADRVWIASGEDLQTLYPETLGALGLQRCKLQMMRTAPAPWLLGPIVAGGLTLAHYESFAGCASLPRLRHRLQRDWPEQVARGIHVLVAQHEEGHLVIGDSHEYGDAVEPFDQPHIDDLILSYLGSFLAIDELEVIERWHGVYVRHPQRPYSIATPEADVTALVGLGGHGMTLAFGLAEELVTARVERAEAL